MPVSRAAIPVPGRTITHDGMRLWWNHLWRSNWYRRASARERRMIEIRYSVARTIKRWRRRAKLTQAELGARVGCSRNTISRIERASNRVALDVGVTCLLELGCGDAELAEAFNPALDAGVLTLRRRAGEQAFPRPRPAGVPSSAGEHRWP